MMSIIIKNNIIAIFVHVCVCIVFLYPVNFMWWGSVWGNEKLDIRVIIINSIFILVYTIIIFSLYFFAGKIFLRGTNNIFKNIASVIVLFIILLVITLTKYDEVIERLLRIPYYPLGGTISSFLHIKEKYGYLIMSIFPSFIMWMGIKKKLKNK
ncbi:MAG: hypothetical protein FWD28_02975 [Treponema sp.]|nr:hypothetical protein [Treponema sp.]